MRMTMHVPEALKHPAEEVIRPIRETGAKLLHGTPEPAKSRPDETDLERYEITPFGRRPKRAGHKKLLVSASIVAAAGLVVWLLI